MKNEAKHRYYFIRWKRLDGVKESESPTMFINRTG